MLGKFVDQKAQENYFATYDAILRKWPVPAEELDVETRFGPTRVRRSGTGQGTPIVLLHGVMGTSLSWYAYVAELAERHTVYAVDTIGEPGRSVQTRPVQSGQDQADWLADVLAGLGHEKFHLVGISRGAIFALDLAMRSGDRIASVIAFEPGGFGIAGLRFVLWSFGQMYRWLLPAPILRRIMSGDPHVRRTLAPLVLRGLKYKPHFPPQHEFTDDELRAIDVPVHFVFAERNNVYDAREVTARVEALNPRLHAEIVPKTTHALPLEEPELTISRILTFVEDDRADLPE
ncbi:alpha/beta fold hydrolase [Lentzea sp. BCCO 10_0856]|uniref:Alpha/beta fold hydrolase n=1 Tax=Lentzea miocenica TaxID=3095431 RepID=A0ABU4SZY8_9PSEU|nr:alpha/beta fold hydrolase [Lentzea sp. BCCO 10_0856]MDX8031317.1 alpha/beta fold hydrolase [Lentzea sp. BCCO 10_0856]